MKKMFNKMSNTVKTMICKAHCAMTCARAHLSAPLCNTRGEGYIDTAIKILIAVVLGALLLAGLYTLFGAFNGILAFCCNNVMSFLSILSILLSIPSFLRHLFLKSSYIKYIKRTILKYGLNNIPPLKLSPLTSLFIYCYYTTIYPFAQ